MTSRFLSGFLPFMLIASVLMAPTAAFAQTTPAQEAKMDILTQDALIAKLEEILPQLSSEKSILVRGRLADLYAERARLKDMAAGEANCNECKDAEKDRKKALSFYESIFSKADADTLKYISLQMAHLYRLTGRTEQAETTFKNILKNKKMTEIHPKAHLGLADLAFEEGDYQKANKEYSLVRSKDANDQTYVAFRQAWAELNIGRSNIALQRMQTAVAFAKSSNNTALLKDLMRDYATILARNPFTAKDVDKFISQSAETDRNENLKFLGEESERLGNKRGALLIWTQYNINNQKDGNDNAEIQLKMAQNFYDLNDYKKTLEQLEKVVISVEAERCSDCSKVLTDFRGLLITWNKKEKTDPSNNLIQAYGKYLRLAEEDFEVMVWAGQVARAQNDFRAAYAFYEQAAYLADKQNKAKEVDMTSTTAIEIAESLKDIKVHERSLNNYLALNPNGVRRNIVLYQLADIRYQNKDFVKAAQEFKKLALDDSWSDKTLRLQAADLSLDALQQLSNKKDDGREDEMRALSLTYSGKFPSKSAHFSEIARRITINRVVALTREAKNISLLKTELNTLKSYNISELPNKDRISHIKTLILGAEKIGDVNGVEGGSKQLLAQKNVSQRDTDFAQKNLLWVYEVRLDFKNAYRIARNMPMSALSKNQRVLRIGLLAELANENPEPYFRQYISSNASVKNANEIRLKLIRRSKNSWAEYNRMFNALRATPDLLARITLELHLAKTNISNLKKAVAVRGVSSTAEGQYMSNLLKRQEFNTFATQVGKVRIDAKSDRSLKRSIKERIKLLERLNQRYTATLRGSDLSQQIIILNTIALENQRFYRQLNQLPVPRGLRKQEREMYKKILLEQSAPYALAAKQAEAKRAEFFSTNEKAVGQLLNLIQSEDRALRAMAMNEYNFLKVYMNRSLRNEFDDNIKDLTVNPKKFIEARREIEESPLDPANLEDLRDLESKRANGPLLAYLDERIAQLKTGSRR